MKSKDKLINSILAEWNPIEVPEQIALYEYKGYIPLIIQSMENEEELLDCLKDILTNKMKLDFDESNPFHRNDLLMIVKKIMLVTQ